MALEESFAIKAMKTTGLSKYTLAQVFNMAGISLAVPAGIIAFNDCDGITVLVAAGVVGYHASCVSYNFRRLVLDDPKMFQDTLNKLKEDNPKRSLLELKVELHEYSDELYAHDKEDAANGKLIALCSLAAGVAAGAAHGYLPPEMKEARDILGYAMFLGPSILCAGLANIFRGMSYKRYLSF